ncbi:hypothetical protein ACQP1K_21190 [Sphaerimonospora sp. CA-214678]|uniref:hypothetical protein n=1 Tax=Sphaerimonospora sp. CA-214678 TaxID=3240029 RepID=UPI003D89BC23
MNDTRTPAASPWALAALSAGAAAIHFGVMPGHFGASLVHGVFFAFVGWAQLAWAAAVLTRRGTGQDVLLTGAFFNLAVLLIWLVGTTAGFPLDPGAWTPQPAQAPDLLCAALEVMLIAGALVLAEHRTPPGITAPPPGARPAAAEVSGPPGAESAKGEPAEEKPAGEERAADGPVETRPAPVVLFRAVLSWAGRPAVRRVGVAALSALVAVAVGASFTPSVAVSVSAALAKSASDTGSPPIDHHHHHGPAATAPDAQAAEGRTDAGNTETGNTETGDAEAGNVEAPTAEAQAAAANALLEVTRREVPERWPTVAEAEKDGYENWTEAEGVRQLAKPELLGDGVALDPTRPEALIYHERPDGSSTLLGVVYMMPPGLPAPVIGGPLTPWQQRPAPCPAGSCESAPGMSNMLYVWLVDYPTGPFGDATGADLKAVVERLATG